MAKPSKDSLKLETKWLTSDDFQYLCFGLAREFMTYQEPIPDYSTHDESLLSSALGAPQHTFDNQLLYPTLTKQASMLFYSLIKNHPFKNGNKRLAVIGLLVFLSFNDKWLDIDPLALYEIACKVSESDSQNREKVMSTIEKVVDTGLVEF